MCPRMISRVPISTVRSGAWRGYPQWRRNDLRRISASVKINLADYLALRNRDLRPLQSRLEAAGLSSLGRGESSVRKNLIRVAQPERFEAMRRFRHHAIVQLGQIV